MKYEVHLPPGVPYLSFVVEYDPYTEEVDKVLTMAEALEWAQVVKNSLGIQDTGSHMADAAQVMGAQVVARNSAPNPQVAAPQRNTNVAPRAQAYQPQQNEEFVDHTQQWVCKQCGGPADQQTRIVNTKFGQKYPVNCRTCKNDRGYAFTTAWADA